MGSRRPFHVGSLSVSRRVLGVGAVVASLVLVIIIGRVVAEYASMPVGLAVFDTPPEPSDAPTLFLPSDLATDTRYLNEIAGWRLYAARSPVQGCA